MRPILVERSERNRGAAERGTEASSHAQARLTLAQALSFARPRPDPLPSSEGRRMAADGTTVQPTASRCGAFLGRRRPPGQIKSGVDQADVAESLRKVTEHATSRRIELFGEQSDIIAVRHQSLK